MVFLTNICETVSTSTEKLHAEDIVVHVRGLRVLGTDEHARSDKNFR